MLVKASILRDTTKHHLALQCSRAVGPMLETFANLPYVVQLHRPRISCVPRPTMQIFKFHYHLLLYESIVIWRAISRLSAIAMPAMKGHRAEYHLMQYSDPEPMQRHSPSLLSRIS